VYYISEVLSDTKTRYPQVQKLLYAVVLARRELRHYFEAHPVTVISSFPLGEIIRNLDAAGRIAKWSVELMGETLAYAPRKAVKSQILADFVAEWTDTQLPSPQIQAECGTLYFDGSVMKTGAGAGLLFVSPLGEHMRYAMRLHFPASNNMAEYEALLCGLKIAIEIGVKRLDVWGDSQLVIDQVMKNASCHDDKMEAYCKAVRALRTSSTSSSSITCPAGTTRRRTRWPRSCPGGSPPPRTFLPEMSPSPLSPSSRTTRTARNPRGLPRIQQARSPWMRTPRTRCTCSLSSRGMVPAMQK
jgi:ribonuclease HI